MTWTPRSRSCCDAFSNGSEPGSDLPSVKTTAASGTCFLSPLSAPNTFSAVNLSALSMRVPV